VKLAREEVKRKSSEKGERRILLVCKVWHYNLCFVNGDLPAMPKHFVVIPAAGIGQRMGATVDGQPLPKQYLLLRGKTLLEHVVRTFLQHPGIDLVIVVVAPGDSLAQAALKDLLAAAKYVGRLLLLERGGASRQNTVLNALTWLQAHGMRSGAQPSEQPWVLVHDAARPGLQQSALQRLLDAVHAGVEGGLAGGILALPIADSLKRALPGTQVVKESFSRQDAWAAQTPQMFRLDGLCLALAQCDAAGRVVTDEASAIEMAGGQVALVLGERRNLKVTVPEDLDLLEAMWTP
jgi:2-C-methyl-D-erythritol 4-phosphate cytidylyltransferase